MSTGYISQETGHNSTRCETFIEDNLDVGSLRRHFLFVQLHICVLFNLFFSFLPVIISVLWTDAKLFIRSIIFSINDFITVKLLAIYDMFLRHHPRTTQRDQFAVMKWNCPARRKIYFGVRERTDHQTIGARGMKKGGLVEVKRLPMRV